MNVTAINAVPAHPKPVTVQQPDGSSVTIRLMGDEWMHFNATVDGYSVVKDSRGYYVYASLEDGRLQPTAQVAHDAGERSDAEQAFLTDIRKYQAPAMTEENAATRERVYKQQAKPLAGHRAAQYDYNNFKGLVLLVQFNDKEFSRPDCKDIMNDMINQEDYVGYTGTNGHQEVYTGSVRDYFSDNSMGKFKPEFDLYGPYTVNFSQYDGNNKTEQILNAALDLADEDLDFSQYDRDGDGYVDLVYFLIAGNGSNYSGNDSRLFWPHRSMIVKNGDWVVKDGVRIWDYASSTELAGFTSVPSSIQIDGIGTICHEFSHVLGLPDFYDSDYEQNGSSNDPGEWSVMTSGCYLNDSRTPVGYSLYERWSVGFMDADQTVLDTEGDYALEPLYTSNTGYRIKSPVNNEYFLFENRQKAFKWDAYLPGNGMLVHRVDKTNMSPWHNNKVNANAEHNYYEVIRAKGYKNGANANDLFPGPTGSVSTLNSETSPANLKTWSGKNTKWGLAYIRMSNGVVLFDVENTYVLKNLELPGSTIVGLGYTQKLDLVAIPAYAEYTVTWSTNNAGIATVDENGVVTGVSEGSCVVTATSDNGCEARCTIIVQELPSCTVEEFKTKESGTNALLKFSDASVLYVYENTAYVRDATGPIMLKDINISLQQYDVLNGTIQVRMGVSNNMPQAVGVEGATNADNLTITAGSEVQSREVSLDNLTVNDYADYVVVKAVKLEKNNGIWAVSGNRRARLWQMFHISNIKVPTTLTDKLFDVTAIYGTDQLNGTPIDELYLLASPEETVETAVREIRSDDNDHTPFYNLQGQRVDKSVKGLLIRNGKKVINK